MTLFQKQNKKKSSKPNQSKQTKKQTQILFIWINIDFQKAEWLQCISTIFRVSWVWGTEHVHRIKKAMSKRGKAKSKAMHMSNSQMSFQLLGVERDQRYMVYRSAVWARVSQKQIKSTISVKGNMRGHVSQNDLIFSLLRATWPVLGVFEQHREKYPWLDKVKAHTEGFGSWGNLSATITWVIVGLKTPSFKL